MMVQLTRIYTRGGDKGKTSLGNGQRLNKFDARINVIGNVDEVNAFLGIVHLYSPSSFQEIIRLIQNDLFDIGADLCMPEDSKTSESLRLTDKQVTWLEKEIDVLNKELSPLNSFVLPGGKDVSAYLHFARTLTRKAERSFFELKKAELLNEAIGHYLNRLSDYFFVLSRYLNDKGKKDILWVPGQNKSI
jgi:cob(I)alamin adenosyltransferase